MSTGSVHLIVTCTRRKTVPAGDVVFQDHRDANMAYGAWLEKLEKASRETPEMTAGELYTGQHWRRATAAAARKGAEMWIISAGLGLLHVTDRVVPYEATFASMPFSSRTIWAKLVSQPPGPRRCASLHSLMQQRPHDHFVLAASPVYLRAIEEDLCAGRDALTSPDRLTIVTTKGYHGTLQRNVALASADMTRKLVTNLTGLNISYATHIIERITARSISDNGYAVRQSGEG